MFENLLSLLERLVVAQETIAKNSSGKPTTTAALSAVAGKTEKPETAAAKKKRLAAEKKAAEEAEADAAEAADTDATPSADVEEKETKQPTKDADEVTPPTKEEIAAAQQFKKDLLAIGRGKENYVERLKAILKAHGGKAEQVPADSRDDVMAAAEAEFASDDEGGI